jgi:hypothetical protein
MSVLRFSKLAIVGITACFISAAVFELIVEQGIKRLKI